MTLTVGLTSGAQAATTATVTAATVTSHAHPFTTTTYGGHDNKSFDGVTFAGTGKPGAVVIVYYDAPGNARGVFSHNHIAVPVTGDQVVSASGHYSFTAKFPDLPVGTTTLQWHARLADVDTLSVIGRTDGIRTLR
ncbi:hypothetical protein NY551_18500 [Curtobacterium flaccumfaciens pv. oortii]|uniref:hypothetical protein n=1 Tax=Curtobacterium flaccumfaciens TaxID=2035 RepID=UPI0026591CD3|nr:hypothetical protein [Curtobacterium flaccumfaciens]MCS5524729.1 hypothetical protein [Curtobacterium flaccumfaciens pv. oortii]